MEENRNANLHIDELKDGGSIQCLCPTCLYSEACDLERSESCKHYDNGSDDNKDSYWSEMSYHKYLLLATIDRLRMGE